MVRTLVQLTAFTLFGTHTRICHADLQLLPRVVLRCSAVAVLLHLEVQQVQLDTCMVCIAQECDLARCNSR
jgi:hypothetical protein